jgi:hypothetical protein
MSYHKREIPRGVFGEYSKVVEEFQEVDDSVCQGNPIMTMVELSDLIGAIEGYAAKYNFTLNDLIEMKNATHRAFISGTRTPRT